MKPLRAILALVLGLTGVGASSLATATQTPEPSETSDAQRVSLMAVPDALGVVRPGTNLRVTVTVANNGSSTLTAGEASLHFAANRFDSAAELGEWLETEPEQDAEPIGHAVATHGDVTIDPRSTTELVFDVPAAELGLTATVTGAYPVTVEFGDEDGELAEARSAIVWQPADATAAVNLGVVMPLVVPREPTGLIDADKLEGYTGSTGLLTRQLTAASTAAFPLAIAIDPMILASIRVLGSDAPQSAVDWMSRLESLPNDTFTLSYADSDLTAALQAGSGAVVQPESFAFALDPARFAAPEEEPGATQTATPSPTSEPDQVALPGPEDLLAWPSASASIGWPAADTVTTADLPPLSAAGYQNLILASGNVDGEGTSAHVNVADQSAVISHSLVSRLLDAAVGAVSTAQWQQEMARLSAVLATMAGTDGHGRTALATLDRTQPSGFRLAETATTLESLPWANPATLDAVLALPPTEANLVDEAHSPEVLNQMTAALQADGADAAFATVAADPSIITSERRLALLAVMSNRWRATSGDWPAAISQFLDESAALRSSVHVVDRGQILVLADRPDLPIAVRNDLDQPVTVTLTVDPLTAGLAVQERSVSVTLEPESQRNVPVPVQSVANGNVPVRVTLTSTPGVQIGQPMIIRVNVQAGWETAGTIAVAVIMAVVFGIGITRNILRRRKEAAAADVGSERIDAMETTGD
ncbi:DUF6049 family protein [Salinibacterium sp. ZJ450]|uniref:DUF6049 family protein n=1 Tax=Salinibacterium sp. ZJ450 TaxID=2708338 RepID=UPI001423F956|nr:DUF6049 family protein [Salinibacterium sp. ZJ450]